MQAPEATLEEIANSDLRRLLARNKTLNCTKIDVGDLALFFKAQNRERSPRRRGTAEILDIDDTGVTASLQSQNFKDARFCVRKRTKESDVADAEWKTSLNRGDPWTGPLDGGTGLAPMLPEDFTVGQEMADGEGPTESGGKSTEVPTEPSIASPRLIPAPNSPTNSGQPDPPPPLEDTGNISASFGRKFAPSQAPERESANCDHLSHDQLHDLCKQRGFHEQDANVAPKTRLEAMDAVARQPVKSNESDMDASSSVLGKRGRSKVEPLDADNPTSGAEGRRSQQDVPAAT